MYALQITRDWLQAQYNTIQFCLMAKNTPADTDATEDYTRKKLNSYTGLKKVNLNH